MRFIKTLKHLKKKKYIFLLGLIVVITLVIAYCVLFINRAAQQQTTQEEINTYKKDSSISSGLDSIRLRDNPGHPDREVIVPTYNLTFSVPEELYTGQELQSSIADSNNAQTVVRLYKKDTKYTKDDNGYDVADNTIIFSFDYPYGVDPIFGASEFVVHANQDTSRTLLTDTITFTSSMLKQRAVSFYKYHDTVHLRYDKKTTDTFRGNARMDLLTIDHLNPTIGVVYSCYDQSSEKSDLCNKAFQMFVSSVRLTEGELKDPPPTYAEQDIFQLLPFAKRNFDPAHKVNTYQNYQLVPVGYYSLINSEEFLSLWDDTKLKSMKCVPDQIFYRGASYFEIANQSGTTSSFSRIDLQDKNLLKILQTLQSRTPEGYVVSQFATCLTDDKRYIVKYNEVIKERQGSGVNPEDIAYAKFVTIDENGNVEPIVDIPNKRASCNRFLALTNDNILYFECRFRTPNEEMYGNNIYRIDLNTKNFRLVATCQIPFRSEGKNPKNFCY